MLNRDARIIGAAIQVIVAWEWLVSGANKLLSGTFPQGLGTALSSAIQTNPNGWYVSFLRHVVMPHAIAFGYTIEFTEIFVGVALLVGAALLLGPRRRRTDPGYRLALVEMSAAAVAAAVCLFLCVNFHFYMGIGIFPGLNPASAYDEGVTLDTLMAPLALLVLAINVSAICDMTETSFTSYLRRVSSWARKLTGSQPRGPMPSLERA